MPRYTFAELLTIFFHLHQDLEEPKTQSMLATALGVSRRTLTGWFAGDYLPRSPEAVLKLAQMLTLTAFQADLLLYAVNPSWVRYGTPADVLATAEVLRYREDDVIAAATTEIAPALDQITRDWPMVFVDQFESNYRRWGLGVKENGMGRLTRSMQTGQYELTLQNQYHEDVFMGGDSACFAPRVYGLTVEAKLVQAEHEDDGYGLMFEEISDECYGFLRVRERNGQASVIQTFDGGDHATVFLRRRPAPTLHPGEWNQLGIVAVYDSHWFYLNGAPLGECQIPRLSHARLNVGVVAAPGHRASACFRDFYVHAPAANE